jgi:hypothetical protein
MQSSVSTPRLWKRFNRINRKKPNAGQVKPFNFLVSATVASFEWPPEAFESDGLHLIAPYSNNPLEWLRFFWTDLHSGREYRIKPEGHSNRGAIRVQTFGDLLDRFRSHPESKSGDSKGNPSHEWTVGLLGRLNVDVLTVSHIGKETNLLEAQEEGVLIADPQAVYSGGGEWEAIRSQLDRVLISELSNRSGVPVRTLRSYQLGDHRPPAKNREAIEAALVRMLD